MLTSPYSPSTLCAEYFRRIAAPLKRPARKKTNPSEARLAAPWSVSLRAAPGPPSIQLARKPLVQDSGRGGVCEVM